MYRLQSSCRPALLALTVAALAGGVASGIDVSAEDRNYLERLALAQARADVLTQLQDLPIHERLTVGVWAARDLGRDRALRLWVRSQPAYAPARFYSDATCDVTVRLLPQELREQLERLRMEHPAAVAEPSDADALRRAAASWPILWGTGTAALPEKPRSHKPAGWEDVTSEGIEVVRRAAEADARHALLKTLGGLPVTNAHGLREFLDSDPAVRAAVLAALEQKAAVKVSFALDQVAVAEARIGMLNLIRILTDVHRQHYRGDLFHAADFRGMALLTPRDEVSASGLAIPPSDVILQPRYRQIELDAPPWVNTALTAIGRYEPGPDDTLDAAERVAAARLDGVDRLRQQVAALVLQRDVSVERFLTSHDALKDDVIIFLSGARVAGPPQSLADRVVQVPVELPLRRLWWILRRGMQRIEVDPPRKITTQPAPEDLP